jgi:hypothetical protein
MRHLNDVLVLGADLPDYGETIRLPIRQWSQDDRLCDRKHHGHGAAPEREDRHNAESEGRMLPDSMPRVPKVNEHSRAPHGGDNGGDGDNGDHTEQQGHGETESHMLPARRARRIDPMAVLRAE